MVSKRALLSLSFLVFFVSILILRSGFALWNNFPVDEISDAALLLTQRNMLDVAVVVQRIAARSNSTSSPPSTNVQLDSPSQFAPSHVFKLYVPPLQFACKGMQCGSLRPVLRNTSRHASFCAPKASEGPYKQHYLYFAQEVLLSTELQKRTGVVLQQTVDAYDADIILCRSRMSAIDRWRDFARQKRRKRDQLYILVEDSDGASVCAPPHNFKNRSLLGVLKHYAWSEHEGPCNPPMCRYRSRDLLDAIAFKGLKLPPGPLNASAADKILVKYNCSLPLGVEASQKVMIGIPSPVTLEVGYKFAPLEEQKPLRNRSIDVAFVGRWPIEKPELDWHRSKLVSKLRNLGKKHKWNIMTGTRFNKKKDFINLLLDVKIFVSPWGLGEWSGKDEEAILAGAVLMKPGANLFEATIPIYRPNRTCLDVRLDWLDFEQTLLRVLGDIPRLEEIRFNAYEAVRRFSTYSSALIQEEVLGKFAHVIDNAKEAKKREESEDMLDQASAAEDATKNNKDAKRTMTSAGAIKNKKKSDGQQRRRK